MTTGPILQLILLTQIGETRALMGPSDTVKSRVRAATLSSHCIVHNQVSWIDAFHTLAMYDVRSIRLEIGTLCPLRRRVGKVQSADQPASRVVPQLGGFEYSDLAKCNWIR